MKSTSPKRQHDETAIPDGRIKEAYTPVANRKILSPTLNKYIKYAKFQVTAAATVVYRTVGGALVSEAIPAAGASVTQQQLVSEIHSTSAVTIYIIHDGILDTLLDQP